MKSTVRAFIAVEISPSVRSEARKSLRAMQNAFPNVKWVDDDNFHVTLKFLGPNVPTTELHHIIAAIQKACRDVEQFDLVFEGLGAFPDASNPRTIWIGVREGVDELKRLASKIEAELGKIGFPAEGREFSPHLTVGRTRQKDREEGQFASRRSSSGKISDSGKNRKFANQRLETNENESEEASDYSALTRMIYDRSNVFFGASPVDAVILYSSELERSGPKYEPLAEIELSPLGSVESEEAFDARQFDDPEFEVPEGEMEKRLPETLDAKFNLESLDDEVEAELRAICGDRFAKRSSDPKKRGSADKPGKRGHPNVGAIRKKLQDLDAPELDSDDFELEEALGFKKSERPKRK